MRALSEKEKRERDISNEIFCVCKIYGLHTRYICEHFLRFATIFSSELFVFFFRYCFENKMGNRKKNNSNNQSKSNNSQFSSASNSRASPSPRVEDCPPSDNEDHGNGSAPTTTANANDNGTAEVNRLVANLCRFSEVTGYRRGANDVSSLADMIQSIVANYESTSSTTTSITTESNAVVVQPSLATMTTTTISNSVVTQASGQSSFSDSFMDQTSYFSPPTAQPQSQQFQSVSTQVAHTQHSSTNTSGHQQNIPQATMAAFATTTTASNGDQQVGNSSTPSFNDQANCNFSMMTSVNGQMPTIGAQATTQVHTNSPPIATPYVCSTRFPNQFPYVTFTYTPNTTAPNQPVVTSIVDNVTSAPMSQTTTFPIASVSNSNNQQQISVSQQQLPWPYGFLPPYPFPYFNQQVPFNQQLPMPPYAYVPHPHAEFSAKNQRFPQVKITGKHTEHSFDQWRVGSMQTASTPMS